MVFIRVTPSAALAFLITLASCVTVPVPENRQDVVRVSAAISLSDVMTTIAGDYQSATGTRVALNLAGSDTLATQLVAGAPADLFVSADVAQMDRVAHQGLVLPGTRVDLLTNQLAIVVRADRHGTVAEVDDLRLPVVRRIALGDPDTVPAGVYAKTYLESIGVWTDVQDKVVPTRNVRAALAAVETGNVDVAIVYRTDVVLAQDVLVAIEVPAERGPVIRYPASVLRDAENRPSARHLLKYLTGEHGRRTFERAGFVVLGE